MSLHSVVADSVGMGLCILSQDGVSVGGCTWECGCLFGCVLWEQALYCACILLYKEDRKMYQSRD